MLSTKVTLGCNHTNCKTTVEANARRAAKVAGRKAGWKVRGTKIHFCPAHRAEHGFPTAAQRKTERLAKKAEKKVTKPVVKAANKKVTKPIAPVAKPVTKKTVKQPITAGVAVPGMVAKSAKRAAAKK